MVYAVFVVSGVILASLERLPGLRFRTAPLFRAFFASDVFYLLTGFVAGTSLATTYVVSASAALGALGVSRLADLDLPLAVGVLVSLISLDLGNYVAHWLMHRYDALWEIHKVHHSSRTVDWLATFRSHFLEQVLRRLLAPLALIAIGVPIQAVILGASAFNAWAMFIHSNLNLDLRALEPILVTPRLHRVHHDARTTHKNFGTLLTLWDRLLRDQFVTHDVAPDVIFGIPDEIETYPQGWLPQLVEPLRYIARAGAPAIYRGFRPISSRNGPE
jgi:sterol desaturase/sphingolipid hydroxylase (fatty acid hydroxylase superfamily)